MMMMMMMMKKITHCVLCITYNQEAFIEKAITSLFQGNVFPDEVIIQDDCSTDGTREIIEKLRLKYPDQIHAIYNPENLGIYKNLNKLIKFPTYCDMVHFLAGDDWVEPGMFERMNQEIQSRGLDPKTESFILIPNYYLFKNNKLILRANKFKKNQSLFGLHLHQEVADRFVGFSRIFFEKFPKYKPELGIWADYYHVLDLARHCDQVYFIDEPFPIYRLGSGITSRASAAELSLSFLRVLDQVETDFQLEMSNSDRKFLRYLRRMHEAYSRPKLLPLINYSCQYLFNIFNGAKLSDSKGIISTYLRTNIVLENALIKARILNTRR